jgi:hypothetical protein
MSKVVILLSDKRSGSTMLQEAMCRHPDIRHVDYSPHTYFETHHWLKSAVLLGLPAALFSGGLVYPGYGSQENARAYIEDTLKGNIPGYELPKNDRALCFEGWEALCRHYAKPVFFEKSPQILAQWGALDLLLEWMEQTELDVKLIGLVRNPLAVQYSAEKLFSTDPSDRQFGWLDIQRNLLALRALLPEQTLKIVRYEDIIDDPGSALAGLCDFIGVEPVEGLGAAVHGGSKEKWRGDASYSLPLHTAVRRVAGGLGYDAAELEATDGVGSRTSKGRSRSAFQLRFAAWRDRWLRPLKLRVSKLLGR